MIGKFNKTEMTQFVFVTSLFLYSDRFFNGHASPFIATVWTS